jgi:sec-independent protein translocase protein TatA
MLGFLGLGWTELLLFLLIVVLLFGATRLPTVARSLGQSITEFKKGVKELENETDREKSE